MARVVEFRQTRPRDGDSASQRTEAYLGYDHSHVYFVFVCFDSEPDKIGVQRDASWVERGSSQYSPSFDTVWNSRGTLTPGGFVVWLALPFKSLRFSPQDSQEWGLLLGRRISRANEQSYWPHVSSRIEGRLNQEGSLLGISDVSPGRNLQLIPYGFFRSFRALDERDELRPQYVSESADFAGGLDVKNVFRDSLVADATLNPDFNQVESDEPQVTVNERFEVFFPEKRPFFLENASFFETPINLFFSRRIGDPQIGVRLTGKAGPYAIGALYADDRAPGLQVLDEDPLFGKKSRNAVLRVSRDMGNQSSVGMLYTDSRLEDSYNRVGGLDARFRFSPNWVGTAQWVASSTRTTDGEELSGPAADALLERTGRKLSYAAAYNDRSPGFHTALGFLPGSRGPGRPGRPRTRALLLRPDFRGLRQTLNYRFRPEGDVLISWGPDVTVHPSWRHDGSPLDVLYSLDMSVELVGRTYLGVFYTGLVERLRPDEDFPDLLEETRYSSARQGIHGSTSYSRDVSVSGEYAWGTVINLVPPEGVAPELASSTQGSLRFTWFATRSIKLEGRYLFSRVSEQSSSQRVFDNHIGRAKLSWQPTPRLTLRSIVQYNSLVADPSLTSLETTKNLNVDVLATYLVNPWTALYVGYNNNQNSRRLVPAGDASELVPGDRLGPDSWQFFVKASYLFRF
jgi:predicted porin